MAGTVCAARAEVPCCFACSPRSLCGGVLPVHAANLALSFIGPRPKLATNPLQCLWRVLHSSKRKEREEVHLANKRGGCRFARTLWHSSLYGEEWWGRPFYCLLPCIDRGSKTDVHARQGTFDQVATSFHNSFFPRPAGGTPNLDGWPGGG